jgi:hypothetical protein
MDPRERDEGLSEAALTGIVRGEALRAEAETRVRPDPARLAEGWVRRFVIEKRRAADFAALYKESGFEVLLDPVAPDLLEEECAGCRLVFQLEYVSLYTRRGAG